MLALAVLLRLADNARLPNRYRQQVRECFVTGAGYGDLSSERAYIRLELLSGVLQSREVMELPFKGYVSGEDGKGGCRSVSRIHAAATGQREQLRSPDIASTTPPITSGHGEPSLSAPRVLRINVFPYVDGEGDFRDAVFVYVRIGSGEWTNENLR